MNYEYDKPIIAQRRTGGSSNPYKEITESLIVNDDAKVILTEIPLEYNRVQVTGDNKAWYEIETGTPTSNQFKVNYINKIIEFDASNIGKQLTFTYTGTGLIYVPTSMIYTEENNGVVTQTLEDLTNEASESAQYAENQGDYAKQQGDYAKAEGEKVDEFVNNTAYVEPYNNATTYEKNNVVSYNGASFMAKQQTVGHPPPDPSVAEENEYWGLLSRKGADGNGTVATHEDRFIASEGQTVFDLSNTYDQFQNRTWVYVGGALQDYPENYEETTSTSITLSEGVPLGTEVVVKYFGESVPVESDIQNTVNNHTNVLANHSERLNQYQSDLTDTDATSGRQPDQSVWKEFEGRGVNVKWFGASGSDQETTGSIDAGSNTLTVTDPKDFKVGHGIVVKGAGEGGVAEEVELQINSVPTSDGNISISLDGTEYTFPVDNGESEAVSLEITGQPTVDGNVTVTLDNVSTNIPVNDGEYEVVSLNITGQPSVDGDIVINLDGIPTNVSVDNGVAEKSSIEIISDPTTAGDVIVTLDGVDHNVTIDPLVEITASDVADKIRNTEFAGWTTGGTVGTSIVTFTSDTTGDRVDTTYNENGTGATGAVTTNVQGIDPDTETEVADKIRNTVFDGWTTSGVGAEVFFTATEKIEKTDATYDDNNTGVTGNISTITQGMSPDTTDEIATKIRNTTFSGWNTSGTGSHITFISDQTGVRDGITYSDNGTGVTGVTNVVNEGVDPDTTEEIATSIRNTEFEGWIVTGSGSVVIFTSVLAEEKEYPIYSDGGTGVDGLISVVVEGKNGEDLLTKIVEINGFDFTLNSNASTTVENVTVKHDDTESIQLVVDFANYNGISEILIPKGTYSVGSLNNISSITFVGDGRFADNKYSVQNISKVISLIKEEAVETTGYGVVFTGVDSFGTYGDLRVAARGNPNMTVNVYPGTVYMPNGDKFTLNSSMVLEAPSKDGGSRKDIVFISQDGELTYLAGSDEYPPLPEGALLLARIRIVSNAIYGRDIEDCRVLKFDNTYLRNEILKFKEPNNTDGAITNVLNTALTYVDRQDFVYGNNKTLFNDDSTANDNGYYEIDCSSFVIAALQGITFENSKYLNNKNYSSANTITFPDSAKSPFDKRMLANDMCRFAYERGWLFEPNKDWSNIRVGDVIFWRNSPRHHFFNGVGHVQLVSRVGQNGDISVYHAFEGNSIGQVIEEKTYTPEELKERRADYCGRFPIGDSSYMLTSINDDTETSFTNTGYNIHNYTLVKNLMPNRTYTAFIKAIFTDGDAYPWLRTYGEGNIYSFTDRVEKRPDNWYKVTFRIREETLQSDDPSLLRMSAVNNVNGGTVEKFYLFDGYVSNPPF